MQTCTYHGQARLQSSAHGQYSQWDHSCRKKETIVINLSPPRPGGPDWKTTVYGKAVAGGRDIIMKDVIDVAERRARVVRSLHVILILLSLGVHSQTSGRNDLFKLSCIRIYMYFYGCWKYTPFWSSAPDSDQANNKNHTTRCEAMVSLGPG